MCVCQRYGTLICHCVLVCSDMVIVGSDDKMLSSAKNLLNSRFDMKDMRIVDVI